MEKLRGFVLRNGLSRNICSLHWSLRCVFRADIGVTVQDSDFGAAAAGRTALCVDAVCGAGGARYPGPTGPDSGGGENLIYQAENYYSNFL